MKVFNGHSGEKGFTFLELLFIVAIIGILAAIAIPTYAKYGNKSFDSAGRSDLRNAAKAHEAYLLNKETYPLVIANLDAPLYNFYRYGGQGAQGRDK